MLIHIFHIMEMGLGMILVFLAVILWSSFVRFSTAVLSITALLLYGWFVIKLLEYYNIIGNTLPILPGIPILENTLSILLLVSFIITLIVFFKEEKSKKDS